MLAQHFLWSQPPAWPGGRSPCLMRRLFGRAKKFSLSHARVGELYHWLFLAMSVTALALSYSRGRATIFTYLTPPGCALAFLGYAMAKYRPEQWLRWHIAGQASSYIALVTGIAFQIVPRFWRSNSMYLGFSADFWTILLTPFVVGTYFIVKTQKKWEQARLLN
jgi:hypothetical protein